MINIHNKNQEVLNERMLLSFKEICKKKEIFAVKTIRLPMSVAAEIVKKDRNLFIIYLTRDPRGSAFSRMKLWWTNFTDIEVVDHMSAACLRMANDYNEYKRLLSMYPHRFVHIRYEDLAYKPVEYASAVYKMLGYDILPQHLFTWIEEYTHTAPNKSLSNIDLGYSTTRNASAVVYAWKRTMKVKL